MVPSPSRGIRDSRREGVRAEAAAFAERIAAAVPESDVRVVEEFDDGVQRDNAAARLSCQPLHAADQAADVAAGVLNLRERHEAREGTRGDGVPEHVGSRLGRPVPLPAPDEIVDLLAKGASLVGVAVALAAEDAHPQVDQAQYLGYGSVQALVVESSDGAGGRFKTRPERSGAYRRR